MAFSFFANSTGGSTPEIIFIEPEAAGAVTT